MGIGSNNSWFSPHHGLEPNPSFSQSQITLKGDLKQIKKKKKDRNPRKRRENGILSRPETSQ